MEMAKNQPMSKQDRRSFLAGLDGEQREIVKALGGLVDRLPRDLRWHHEVGRQVVRLQLRLWAKQLVRRPEEEDMSRPRGEPRFPHGGAFVKRLAGFLNLPDRSLLDRCRRFAEEHPEDLEQMEEWRVTWNMFEAALASPTPQERLDLLERASRDGWNAARVRREVRAGREERHAGGRPTSRPQADAPAAGLQDLIDRARYWARYIQEGWLEPKQDEDDDPLLPALPELARQGPDEELVRLLGEARAELRQTISRATQLLKKLPSEGGPGS
jgi:hypothetical protein